MIDDSGPALGAANVTPKILIAIDVVSGVYLIGAATSWTAELTSLTVAVVLLMSNSSL